MRGKDYFKMSDMNNYMAVKEDGEGVLGKLLYYSLSSILVERERLKEICDGVGFPNTQNRRTALTDAFRSATGDIFASKTYNGKTIKVYCRDNKTSDGTISRELIKETLDECTNDYKKLANIIFSKDMGISYTDLVFDDQVDAYDYCREAVELFELYQSCVGRRQIETLLEDYIDSLSAVKVLAHGKMYFIPREHMDKLEAFEDFVQLLEESNQRYSERRAPLDSNSIFVVDDAKQREKMANAFYRSVRREIADYTDKARHLIETGSESAAVLNRWVLKIRGLEAKKREYEAVLQRELHDTDDEFTSLGYLADELTIRARGIFLGRGVKKAA
jgi:hypothetical protein